MALDNLNSNTSELDVSIHPFSRLPSTNIVKKILSYLSINDKRNCRLVCQNWDSMITQSLRFSVRLSDMTMMTFLSIRRIEDDAPQLNIAKIIASDLSPFSSPFTSSALEDQLRNPETVKELHFKEGVSSIVKQNFLLACRWIEYLKFEKSSVPRLPEGLVLKYLTKFEMSPGAYNESSEVETFFQTAHFPALTEASIQIHCRGDYDLYASVHYFAANHYGTLRTLNLIYIEAITGTSYFKKTKSFTKDFEKVALEQRRRTESTCEYTNFLYQVQNLRLNNLTLWLVDNKDFVNLSMKLVSVQKHLTTLEVSHPSGCPHDTECFHQIIQNNAGSLRKLTIPRLHEFDCKTLSNCHILESFCLGREFYFYDCNNYHGSILDVELFPNLTMLKSVSMGSPLTKSEIYWMFNHLRVNTFLFIASPNEEYTLRDLEKLIGAAEGPSTGTGVRTKMLMMCITISSLNFNRFEIYLSERPEIDVRVIYYSQPNEDNPGTAHFSIKM